MKRLYAGILAVSFLGAALTVLAAAPEPGPGPSGPQSPPCMEGPARPPHLMGGHLDLSAAQKDKMRELERRYSAETRDLRYDLAHKKLDMRKLFTDPKTDETTLLAKQRELGAVEQKLHDKMGQMKIEGRRILTAEQIQKLDLMPLEPPMPPPGMGAFMMPPRGPEKGPEKGPVKK
jgi:Spy/CpxP family protein refolding chaperone